jgi:hypothetical protein
MEQGQKTGVADLLVRVWGMGANGRPFFQNVYARNLRLDSALLSGIDHPLTPGDTIGIQLGDRKARFRVVSARDLGLPQKVQAEVQILNGQECPWKEHVASLPSPGPSSKPAIAPSPGNKRRFDRHKIPFPIEIRDDRGGGAPMQTNASDISGRGCYVESLVPLPLGTPLSITFWLDSEKVTAGGLVRTSDPGVGMGIEFIGLRPEVQQRLQQQLETLEAESKKR